MHLQRREFARMINNTRVRIGLSVRDANTLNYFLPFITFASARAKIIVCLYKHLLRVLCNCLAVYTY